jgi:hypothetical protein
LLRNTALMLVNAQYIPKKSGRRIDMTAALPQNCEPISAFL